MPDAAQELTKLTRFYYNVLYVVTQDKTVATYDQVDEQARQWLKEQKFPVGHILVLPAGPDGFGAKLDEFHAAGWKTLKTGVGRTKAFAEAFRAYGFSDKAFCASYGLAECVLGVSVSETGTGMLLDHVEKDALEAHRAVPAAVDAADTRTFVSCGKVLPEHRGEIRDEAGKVLGEREVGRFFVQGPSVMQGYFNDEEATTAALIDGWLDTGDLAYWIGEELVIVGRAKDMMIINGRNVWPQDIEWTVEHIDGLRSGDSAAIVLPNADGTDRPTVLVQCRAASPDDRLKLHAEVRTKVQDAVGILCDVVLVPARSLPKTTSGKLARGRAKKMFEAGEILPLEASAPVAS